LVEVNLSGQCELVTDSGVQALANGCPKLTRIDLTLATELVEFGAAHHVARTGQISHLSDASVQVRDVTTAEFALALTMFHPLVLRWVLVRE
jgi:hypothetical protein